MAKKATASTGTTAKKTSTRKQKTVEIVETPVECVAANIPAEITVEAKKKILFVASEAAPFIATGGLAEVIGSLSKALAKEDKYDVRVMIPLYQDIKKEYRKAPAFEYAKARVSAKNRLKTCFGPKKHTISCRPKGRSAPLACCLPHATGRRCCHGACRTVCGARERP